MTEKQKFGLFEVSENGIPLKVSKWGSYKDCRVLEYKKHHENPYKLYILLRKNQPCFWRTL